MSGGRIGIGRDEMKKESEKRKQEMRGGSDRRKERKRLKMQMRGGRSGKEERRKKGKV